MTIEWAEENKHEITGDWLVMIFVEVARDNVFEIAQQCNVIPAPIKHFVGIYSNEKSSEDKRDALIPKCILIVEWAKLFFLHHWIWWNEWKSEREQDEKSDSFVDWLDRFHLKLPFHSCAR